MRVALALAVLVMFPLSGCTQGPIVPDPWSILWMFDENTKDLDELHFVFDEVELHYAGANGEYRGNEYVFSRDLGLDLEVGRAHDSWAVFAGEADIPGGEYSGMTFHFAEAYGIKNGERVSVALTNMVLHVPVTFTTDDAGETRTLLELDGRLSKQGGEYTFSNEVSDVTFTVVDDDASGSDVWDVGQLVQVPEAA